MKRRLLIPVLFAAAALAGCMDDVQPVAKDLSSELTFAASSVETKGIVTGEDLVDATDGSRTLYISAFLHPQSGREDNYFTNEAFTLTDGYWRHDPKIYWPMGGQLDFLAYSAAQPFGDFDAQWGTARWGEPDASARLRLAVGPDRTQDDILFGALYHKTVPAGGGALNMVMNHAQAWIEVTFSKGANVPAGTEIVVDDVVLSSVYLRGDFDVENNYGAPERAATWNFRRAWKEDVTVDDINHILGTPLPDEAVSVSMLLPEQEMTTLTVTYTMDGVQKTWSQELPHAYWNMGKHYVYAITFDKPQRGDLSLEVTTLPWNTGYEFNTLEEPLLGNVIYGTGDRVDRLGDAFDLSSTSALYWRADGTSEYQILRYEDGTWGSDINTSLDEWEVNIKALGGGDYQLTPVRNLRRVPLTMTVKTPGTLVYKRGTSDFGVNPIEYSINRGEWIAVQSTTDGARIPLEAGDEIRLRGDNARYYFHVYGWNRFAADEGLTFDLSGNIMSLIVSDEFSTLEEMTTASNFMALFQGNTGVISARELILPGKSVPNSAYMQMFENCTNMTAAPAVISAESIGPNVFNSMFHGCTSLVLPPDELPATSVPDHGYYRMFRNCSSLVKAPSGLDGITEVKDFSLNAMFEGCTVLSENIPERLPALSLPAYAYGGMFNGCKALTRAPEIDAEVTTGRTAMANMFLNCSSLVTPPSEIKVKDLLQETFSGMFSGCSSLTYTPDMTVASVSGVSSCQEMFNGCTNLRTINITWNEQDLANATCRAMFQDCKAITSAMPQTIASVDVNSCLSMYNGCSSLAAASVTFTVTDLKSSSLEAMFANCTSLTAAPALRVETAAVQCTRAMYEGCTALETAPVELAATTLYTRCYYAMFNKCYALRTAVQELPATTLAEQCYMHMFTNCTVLEQTPLMTINGTASSCCHSMFEGCKAITAARVTFDAPTLEAQCFYRMFYTCPALESAPEMNFDEAKADCCYLMYANCTSLVTAPPVLPAMTLGNCCYYGMFTNTKSLERAPELPATVAAPGCYGLMFDYSGVKYGPSALPLTTLAEGCCKMMFAHNHNGRLVSAPADLPATVAAKECYSWMFNGCSGLTAGPQIHLKTLAQECCYRMFEGCSNMVTGPTDFGDTEPASSCFASMFYGCNSMTTAPASLYDGPLASYCYRTMFYGCHSLISFPELPSTELAESCYNNMFYQCFGMTTAPTLPAETLVKGCYYNMFWQCSNLTSVKMLATDYSAQDCLTNWLSGANTTGTITLKAGVTPPPTGVSGVPTGWTVVYE